MSSKPDMSARAYRVTITGLAIYAPMSADPEESGDTVHHMDVDELVSLMTSEHNYPEVEIVELVEPAKVDP